ncbi:tetratricopeptide repeat-containing sulfotransferase family protein [Tropicibacter oceani]|uniref:Sulfotransferase n=1 Tax=Tropicibacter oceani TaxID=3058420 RepID=A0ABY8QFB7_9RHOB|nr:tetratricopeptide repeat-containing sulfotransferase family protein [Tropicibacter oceani]WGW02708.1 sulfotransferase [Tropicibacter oceani]
MSPRPAPTFAPQVDPVAHAAKLSAAGKPAEAAALLRRVLSRDSRNAAARKALAGLGKHARPALNLTPQDRKDAKALERAVSGAKWPQVISGARALLGRQPLMGDAANALGTALRMSGQLNDAMRAYDHALRADPALPDSYINLSALLLQMNQPAAALDAAQAALDVAPKMAESHLAMGLALYDLDRISEAEGQLRQAVDLGPENPLNWDALCRTLERLNRLDDLGQTVQQALKACPDHPLLQLHAAAALSRRKDNAAALALLDRIKADALPPHSRSVLEELRGRVLDALGHCDEAFAAYTRMNDLQRRLHVKPGKPNSYAAMVDARLGGLDDLPAAWPQTLDSGPQPVFLVGFPRSGTTLLDTILRGHDHLAVVEEQPLCAHLSKGIAPDGEAAALAALTPQQIDQRRAAYLADFERHLGAPLNGRLPVDKMPLNLSEAGAIARHFPGAKFILALRHPADSVLSCYMQNFRPNEAMNNFLDLEQAARLYDRVFTLFDAYRARLGLDVVEIRYEDLITDLRGAVEPVLTHLGLDWHDDMADYQSAARARPVIRTPSYKQVTQGLYTSAQGRWHRYQAHMTPALDHLKPWIERWGYDA